MVGHPITDVQGGYRKKLVYSTKDEIARVID
jgi:hypothetical protein